MPLSSDLLTVIETQVRGGFETRESLLEHLCEEVDDSEEASEIGAAIDAAMARLDQEKATWPDETDCDRLDRVFEALRSRGILALQNAGYTQRDGLDDVSCAYSEDPEPERWIGYCFYHGQDLERAVAGHGLDFAHGPLNPSDADIASPRVGQIIVEELHRAGFQVRWSGSQEERIAVPLFDWKRR